MVTAMDNEFRRHLRALYAEDDRARIEHAAWMAERQAQGQALMQKSDEDSLIYRTHDDSAPAPAAVVETVPSDGNGAETDWSGWETWMQGHLDNLREELLDGVAEGMSMYFEQRFAEKRREWQTEIDREFAVLRTALTERDANIARLEGRIDTLLSFIERRSAATMAPSESTEIDLPNWRQN
jgi:hypothetical protein